MKKLIILLLCFSCIRLQAQNGFFLQPSVGIGFSNIKQSGFAGTTPHRESVFTYTRQFGFGYHLKNLDLNTGIRYLRTGSKTPITFSSSPTSSYMYAFDYRIYFYHLTIPIGISYRLRLNKKFQIVPGAGFEWSYNLFAKNNTIQNADHSILEKISRSDFDANYKRTSIFGTAKVNFDYRLNKNLSLFAGPTACYMVTNMFKKPAGAPYALTQRNYACLLNLGIECNLPHRGSAGKVLDSPNGK